jgi:hypothetical protein
MSVMTAALVMGFDTLAILNSASGSTGVLFSTSA